MGIYQWDLTVQPVSEPEPQTAVDSHTAHPMERSARVTLL